MGNLFHFIYFLIQITFDGHFKFPLTNQGKVFTFGSLQIQASSKTSKSALFTNMIVGGQ